MLKRSKSQGDLRVQGNYKSKGFNETQKKEIKEIFKDLLKEMSKSDSSFVLNIRKLFKDKKNKKASQAPHRETRKIVDLMAVEECKRLAEKLDAPLRGPPCRKLTRLMPGATAKERAPC